MELDDDPAWRQMADDIATLCLDKFIDPANGALRENFAADWSLRRAWRGASASPDTITSGRSYWTAGQG